MGIPIDKLSRVSALRPSLAHPAGEVPRQRDDSKGIPGLRTECHRNALGSHLRCRKWYPAPPICRPGVRSLTLLGTAVPEEAMDATRWIFLDTETTGLAGGTGTYAFLIGLAWWGNGGLAVEQLFMRDHSEEPSLLLALSQLLRQRPVLVTFNGKSFDWPLLETRFRVTRAAPAPPLAAHLDLIHPSRQLWRLRLPCVSLAEIERSVLAVDRDGDIPSSTIPSRYFGFLRGGPAEPIVDVFRHNQMDLRGLASLAVHMIGLLESVEAADSSAGELYGMSRLLQRRGEHLLAGRIYERALALGLPEAEERTARRELALLAKRRQDFPRANDLWEDLLGDSGDGLRAYEQLAIYHEHHLRDIERAASLTRGALVCLRDGLHSGRVRHPQYQRWHDRFRHRLRRLEKKQREFDRSPSEY